MNAGPRADEVHVWIVPLDRPRAEIERLHGLLAADERERAGTFMLAPRKRRYVARQGVLREILAHCSGRAPEKLVLVRGDHGKPALAGGEICFSVSDSHDLALIALGQRELGVDLERVIERRAVSRALPGARTPDEFYEAWTTREAASKATGAGLFGPPCDTHAWRSWKIAPARGFVATLVADREVLGVATRRWTS